MPFKDLETFKFEKVKERIENNYDFYTKLIMPNSGKKRNLLIGQVQSGKTRAIEQCILLSPNYYDCVIVFGGTNNLLNNQSEDRFKKSPTLKSSKIKLIDAKYLEKRLNANFFWDKKIFPVLVVLKGDVSISRLRNIFNEILLRNKKILIIDDESDYASINISSKSYSKIYKQIQELISSINHNTVIEVTATPFANILTKSYDLIELLPPGEGYTGSDFFIKNRVKYQILDSSKKQKDTWDRSVYTSLLYWLISTSYYIYKTGKTQKSEFLINIDLTTPSHAAIRDLVCKKLLILSRYPSKNLHKKDIFKYFKITDEKIINTLIETSKEIIEYLCSDNFAPVLSLNSKMNKYKSGGFQYSIVIGGTLVSRGFTFQNLLTELILNSPDEKIAIDTMLQRARWFGYRHNNDDMQKFMTIFLNKNIYKMYEQANKVIDFINKNYNHPNLRKMMLSYMKQKLIPEKIILTNKKMR